MNKKNILKIILDFGMIIVLVLMYNKSVINLSFHEIGGLILLGVMLIHVLLNWKWVVTITKKIFRKTIPIRTKLGYILNLLLLISFALIGISGIFISKIVFHISNNGGISWKTVHYTSAAVALILIGIHIGMHHQFISGMIKKIFRIPEKPGRIVGLILTAVLFTYGCYSLATSSFSQWLTMPFTTQQMEGNFDKGGHGGFDGERPQKANEAQTSQSDDTSSTADVSATDNSNQSAANVTEGAIQVPGAGKGDMKQNAGSGNVINVLLTYFSITFVFTAITAILDKFLKLRKQKK